MCARLNRWTLCSGVSPGIRGDGVGAAEADGLPAGAAEAVLEVA